jgi:2-polyprenyl-3-methyl-5-hydroxy-6-metoxy-1,4-benzoquinol methylase
MGGPDDKSNGYEQAAQQFIAARNTNIGIATVRDWSRSLKCGGNLLDLGCAHGVPITQLLIDSGFSVYGLDASTTLIVEFRRRFPTASAQCAAVEDSDFFGRQFDGIIAVGLLFLLSSRIQENVLQRIALALISNGKFLFTAPAEAVRWNDSLTGRESVSLGSTRYAELLRCSGMELLKEASDEGGNHYYFCRKL